MREPLQLALGNAGDGDKLCLEDEDRVRGNRAHSPTSVSHFRLDSELSLVPNAHVSQTLVPTLDDLSLANVEAQRLASVVAGIELLATILEGTAVVNLNLVACRASLVSNSLISMMLLTILLTNLSLAGTFNGCVDLNVQRLVQSRSCCGKEC